MIRLPQFAGTECRPGAPFERSTLLPDCSHGTRALDFQWSPNGIGPRCNLDRSSPPAFLKPPEGAPAYYGFPLLSGIERDGFKLGMITDFTLESDALEGDLYIVRLMEAEPNRLGHRSEDAVWRV